MSHRQAPREWRKMSDAETAAIDAVACSYQNVKTGEIIPPWVADPQNAGLYLKNYLSSVRESGGTWNPYGLGGGGMM